MVRSNPCVSFIPARTIDLIPNRLYYFAFSNGNARGSEVFAIVEIEGELKIVQFDESKMFDEIVAEYLEMIRDKSGSGIRTY